MTRPPRRTILRLLILLIVGVVVVLIARKPYVRWKQNNVSVYMQHVVASLTRQVQVTGEWPRSWQEVFPDGMNENDQRSTQYVTVNWGASVADAVLAVDRLRPEQRTELMPNDNPPILVAFTDSVPRDDSLRHSERSWNWLLAQRIYFGVNEQRNAPSHEK